MKNKDKLGIVIPYYNAREFIISVVEKAIYYSNHIVIINDKSPDELPVDFLSEFPQVQIINAPENLGVGGATKLGLEFLKNNNEVEVIIKLDADDQMDTSFIPSLVEPILNEDFGFAKGNRFRDFKALKEMPFVRRFGNTFLSFLSKIATGYWNCFDFNNGFFAISKKNVSLINFNAISNNYFFETSLISELYFQDVKIKEIAMP
ncbi:MAG: glycosyltransferase family 2 protein, partial [Flavobacteriaceae bacterium]|nr:glycosyltransferase family 2 protein [Flavobacteriaceae bacterium]